MKHLIGRCIVCDAELFDVKAKYDAGPIDGEPRSLGLPHDDAMRATLVLVSGARMTVTVCADCLERLPVVLDEVHATQIETHWWEFETRGWRGASALSEKQKDDWRGQLARRVSDPPIGVLHAVPWRSLVA